MIVFVFPREKWYRNSIFATCFLESAILPIIAVFNLFVLKQVSFKCAELSQFALIGSAKQDWQLWYSEKITCERMDLLFSSQQLWFRRSEVRNILQKACQLLRWNRRALHALLPSWFHVVQWSRKRFLLSTRRSWKLQKLRKVVVPADWHVRLHHQTKLPQSEMRVELFWNTLVPTYLYYVVWENDLQKPPHQLFIRSRHVEGSFLENVSGWAVKNCNIDSTSNVLSVE